MQIIKQKHTVDIPKIKKTDKIFSFYDANVCVHIVFSPVNNPVWIVFRHTHLTFHGRDGRAVKLHPLC